MKNFAQQGGRPGSPHTSRPTSAARRQIAANAKVQLKRPTLNQQEPVQHQSLSRRLSEGSNHAQLTSEQPQHRQQGHSTHVKRDPYDTDAESLDTTLPHGSVIQAPGSQRDRSRYDGQHGNEDNYNGESDGDGNSGDEEGDYDEQEWDDDEEQALMDVQLGNASYEEQLAYLVDHGFRQDMFGGGQSYPTTTSGGPNSLHGSGQVPDSDNFDDQGSASPSPQRPAVTNQSLRQFADQPIRRPSSAADSAQPMQRRTNLFQQGAAIRGQSRSDTNLNARSGRTHQKKTTAPRSSQPPSYSQVTREPNSEESGRQNTRTEPSVSLPQRGVRHVPEKVHVQSTKSVEAQAAAAAPILRQVKDEISDLAEPSVHHLTGEVEAIGYPHAGPVEDYDRSTLFDLNYSQLKNEDFDTVPRGLPPVLSEDMQRKTLVERLEYVQNSLNATDQAKFFSSLPTTEWEDAGDWFLDQFSNIVQRTKQVRQNKRKLAKEFEDEVEKRHKQVTKKQCQVDEALEEMKSRGQGLIKNPKGSKSPAKG